MRVFLSWCLLMAGLVIASLAVAHVTDQASLAGLFMEPFFLVGLATIVAAIALKRTASATRSEQETSSQSQPTTLAKKIKEIERLVGDLLREREKLTRKELIQRLTALLEAQVFEVVSCRDELIERVGYGAYAHFMGDFATAERFLSRAWSASVDNYESEAYAYLEKAGPFLASSRHTLEHLQ